jgi:dTDP-4-amino-4,6-dideoxygalactose transaminase
MNPHEELEQQWSKFCGMPHCVAVNSGTAALHLALEALQLPKEGIVLVPEYTMIACARAVTLAGLEPRFLDCNRNLLIDLTDAETSSKWSRNVRAIMPVHIYGRRCDMNRVHDLAKQNSLKVIEDLAEAHGINPDPRSDAAAWSLYKNKIVHSEEGGIIAFREKEPADLARQLRSLGFTDKHDFYHIPRGMNYRMPDSQAKLAISSLSWLSESLEDRRQIEDWYGKHLLEQGAPLEWLMPAREVVWVFDLWIQGMTCDQQAWVVGRLNGEGIAARHGFKSLSKQPEYRMFSHGPVAAEASRSVVYLPVSPGMTEWDCAKAVEILMLAATETGLLLGRKTPESIPPMLASVAATIPSKSATIAQDEPPGG